MADPPRSPMLQGLGRFNDMAAEAALWLAMALLVALVAVNAAAVGLRYGAGIYPAWVIEVSRTLMISIVFLGAVYLYRTRRHIAVSFVVDRLPDDGAPKRLLAILCELTVLVFAAVVIWQAMVYQPILFRRLTPVLRLPENLTSIFVPIAYFLILLNCVEALLSLLRAKK